MSAWIGRLKRVLEAAVGPAPAAPATCKVCGKILTNPASIAAGMGSCCARKASRVDTRTIDLFEGGTVGSEAM